MNGAKYHTELKCHTTQVIGGTPRIRGGASRVHELYPQYFC